jgi:hypothetical protein
MDLRMTGLEGVDWIRLAQDTDRWRAVVSTVINLSSSCATELVSTRHLRISAYTSRPTFLKTSDGTSGYFLCDIYVFTECRGRVVNSPYSYSGDIGFKSRAENQLSGQVVRGFFSPS